MQSLANGKGPVVLNQAMSQPERNIQSAVNTHAHTHGQDKIKPRAIPRRSCWSGRASVCHACPVHLTQGPCAANTWLHRPLKVGAAMSGRASVAHKDEQQWPHNAGDGPLAKRKLPHTQLSHQGDTVSAYTSLHTSQQLHFLQQRMMSRQSQQHNSPKSSGSSNHFARQGRHGSACLVVPSKHTIDYCQYAGGQQLLSSDDNQNT
jgi:hypothetical protein